MTDRVSRRQFLQTTGGTTAALLLFLTIPAYGLPRLRRPAKQLTTHYTSRLPQSKSHPSASFPRSRTTANFLGHYSGSRKAAPQSSTSSTTPTLPNSCTGMASAFPPMWMEPPRKALLPSPLTACAVSPSLQSIGPSPLSHPQSRRRRPCRRAILRSSRSCVH
jgi:TAT (twin-arginine translocation) pathway signal sequence.